MARWRLRQPHYLNTVKPAIWRHEEQSQASGEKHEQDYIVPRYLDPGDPKQMSRDGEVVVCLKGKGEKGDWEVADETSVTPDMDPIDEEAQEISDRLAPNWAHPIETLPSNSSSMLSDLQRENAALKAQLEAKSGETARRA